MFNCTTVNGDEVTLALELEAVTTKIHEVPVNPENVVGLAPLVVNPEDDPLMV